MRKIMAIKLYEILILLQATADNYNLIARFNANLKYKELMTKTLEEERSYFTDDEFQKIHRQHKSSCIDQVKRKFMNSVKY